MRELDVIKLKKKIEKIFFILNDYVCLLLMID